VETITDIARFGRHKLAFLRRFRAFADGTPAHDHLGDIPRAVRALLCRRGRCANGGSGGSGRIDGKTVRRTGSKTSNKKKDPKGPIHIVSAFAARLRLVLGQIKVGEKSNETVAIPKLLRTSAIEGAIIDRDGLSI